MGENLKNYQQDDIEDSSHFSQSDLNSYNRYDRYYDEQIKNIRLVVPWLIVTFGLLGNILILIIFSKKLRKRSSNAFCFVVLAISDILAVVFMLFRALLKTEILNNLNASCKAIKFLYHYFLQTSSWCLVLLTLDRLVAVCFIFKYKTWCKKFHVLKIFICIIVVVCLINLHLLVFVNAYEKKGAFADGLSKLNNQQKRRPTTINPIIKKSYVCNVSIDDHPTYFKHIYKNWDIFHAVFYGGLPFLLILTANCIIICRLLRLQKASAKYLSDEKNDNSDDDSSIKSYQLTIMLLTVSFTFLILTSPISLYMAFIYDNLTHVRISKREFIKIVLRYLGYVNNSINFYVYFCTSNEFRREVFQLFKSILPTSTTSSIYTACTASSSLPDINIETKPVKKPNLSNLKANHELQPESVLKPIEAQKMSQYNDESPIETKRNIYRPKIIYSKPFDQRISEFEREQLYSNNKDVEEKFIDNNRRRIHKVIYDGQKNKRETEAFLKESDNNNSVLVTHL